MSTLEKKDDLCLKGNRVNNKPLLCVLMHRKECCWYCHLYSTLLQFENMFLLMPLWSWKINKSGCPPALLGLTTAHARVTSCPQDSPSGLWETGASILEGLRPGWILLISLPLGGCWEKGKRRVWRWRWRSQVIPPPSQETFHTTRKEAKQLPLAPTLSLQAQTALNFGEVPNSPRPSDFSLIILLVFLFLPRITQGQGGLSASRQSKHFSSWVSAVLHLSVGNVAKPLKMPLKWQERNSSPYVNCKTNETNLVKL